MCGIVGIISKSPAGLFKGHADLFKQMLFVDQLRGVDGTGIIYDDNGKTCVRKSPENSGSFLSKDWVKNGIEDAIKTGSFLIGHNRAATKGSISWENTHPFTENHITLIHNGTLFSHKTLDDKKEVDSHAICSHMAINGAEETLKTIDGAFALVWINETEQTINMARNKERPLHLVECSGCWIISSELGLGLWMAERHGLTVTKAFQLKTETLYTLPFNNLGILKEKEVSYYKWYRTTPLWGSAEAGVVESKKNIRKNKRNQQQQTSTNIITLPPTKSRYAFGESIVFRPLPIKGESIESCLIWDDKRTKYFILGEMISDKSIEIRVYGTHAELRPFINSRVLSGTIVMTVVKSGRMSYWIENTKVVVPMSKEDATLVECDVCGTKTLQKDIAMYNGKPLCDTCHTTFVDNPQLASTMGYH